MSSEMTFVRDLAVILISAGAFTIISRALKQPLILGYIIAGFLIGPNIDFFFGISSGEAVSQWSEIGIIFMMFGLGLEFSFKKLLKVGSSALITAGVKFLGVFVLGYVAGQAMSWTSMESIFLGGLLAMSSTIVIVKTYDEMGLKNKPYAALVFGTLVIEDLIAIMLMVLLSSLAVSKHFEGQQMAFNLGKLGFFIVLWFLVGIFIIPSILRWAKKYINNEILLIVSLGLCFGMVTIAELVGFSSALGAFVMGSILAETIEGETIEKVISPIKDLFGAIFFVSVGMMMAPAVLAKYWLTILIITLLVYLSHIIFVSLGVVLAGKGLRNAVNAGFSLAQLGEFGFIIAGVGCALGVMRDFIYPVVIAVTVITTFTTPYMIRLAEPTYKLLARVLPKSLVDKLEISQRQSGGAAESSQWKKLLKAYFLRIMLYGVVILGVCLAWRYFVDPNLLKLTPTWSADLRKWVSLSALLLCLLPFLFGMGISSSKSIKSAAKSLIEQKPANSWLLLGLMLGRSFMAIAILMLVISTKLTLAGWAIALVIISLLVLSIIARKAFRKLNIMEDRFLANLNAKEAERRENAPVTTSVEEKMRGYDVRLEVVRLPQDSSFSGMKLRDIPFRAKTGVNIIKIQRGAKTIIIPSAETQIFPMDEILAVGTLEQIDLFKQMIQDSRVEAPKEGNEKFSVAKKLVTEDSEFAGKKLCQMSLRQRKCMVISVLHGDKFITNPGPDFIFTPGDTIWLAGENVD